jgi:hypothetical protein
LVFFFFCRLNCENRGAHALTKRAIVPHEFTLLAKILSCWWILLSRALCVGSFVNYITLLLLLFFFPFPIFGNITSFFSSLFAQRYFPQYLPCFLLECCRISRKASIKNKIRREEDFEKAQLYSSAAFTISIFFWRLDENFWQRATKKLFRTALFYLFRTVLRNKKHCDCISERAIFMLWC